jgi:hypothetical protein
MSMVLTDNNDTDGTPRTTTDSVSISVSPAAIYANGTPLTYIATSGPLAIGGVSVAGGVVDSAEVTIGTNFTSGEDSLGFQNQLGINGSYNSATGVLTLTGTASAADYQLALNSVTYSDSNPQPNLATRAISFQLSSGGVESPAVNRSIAVQSLSANSTLTVNGSSGQDTIEVIFSSPTAFAVIDNGATANYTTTTYQHIVIAGGTGDETIIYDDPYNPLTTDVSLGTAHGNSPNVFFVVSGATTLYIYANATSSTVLNAAAGNQFVVGVGSSTLNYSYLSDGVSHYSEVAYAADTVFLGQGGSNYAYLYSMSGASDLGDQTQSWMNAGSQVIVSSGFPQTYIVGAADGTDSVALDSDGSKFIGTPSFSYVTDDSTSGYSFLIGALYAKNVIAQAAGTTDTAFYYSGSGDTFTASASGDSSLTGDTSNFTSFKIQAIGYQALIAWSAGDGTDSAALSSTGGATFVGTGTYSTLAVGSNSIEVFGFAHVMADDANGGGDMATLYDSPGTNALTAQGSQAVLANSQVTLTVNNYANVSAVQQTGNDDTKHIGAIDFALSTLGNWTSD